MNTVIRNSLKLTVLWNLKCPAQARALDAWSHDWGILWSLGGPWEVELPCLTSHSIGVTFKGSVLPDVRILHHTFYVFPSMLKPWNSRNPSFLGQSLFSLLSLWGEKWQMQKAFVTWAARTSDTGQQWCVLHTSPHTSHPCATQLLLTQAEIVGGIAHWTFLTRVLTQTISGQCPSGKRQLFSHINAQGEKNWLDT